MNNDTLSDQLQVWGFESDCILFSDGSLGFGLELTPIDVSCWEDEAVNSFSEHVMQVLNGIPADTDLQFIQEIESGNAKIIAEHLELTESNASDTAKTLCQKRADRILEMDSDGLVPSHKLKLFVRRPISMPLIEKQSAFLKTLWAKPKLFPSIAEHALKCLEKNKRCHYFNLIGRIV